MAVQRDRFRPSGRWQAFHVLPVDGLAAPTELGSELHAHTARTLIGVPLLLLLPPLSLYWCIYCCIHLCCCCDSTHCFFCHICYCWCLCHLQIRVYCTLTNCFSVIQVPEGKWRHAYDGATALHPCCWCLTGALVGVKLPDLNYKKGNIGQLPYQTRSLTPLL